METIKSQIESLGFEFLHKYKRDGLFYASHSMNGGILIDGKSYKEVLDNIEIYLKDFYQSDEDDYYDEEDFVAGCGKCGKDVHVLNDMGLCNKCK
jgi:hypothetical protein